MWGKISLLLQKHFRSMYAKVINSLSFIFTSRYIHIEQTSMNNIICIKNIPEISQYSSYQTSFQQFQFSPFKYSYKTPVKSSLSISTLLSILPLIINLVINISHLFRCPYVAEFSAFLFQFISRYPREIVCVDVEI